ncbi:MAG: tol-pal system YbgF family protein, partial [Polyangiales bacterium]
MQGRLNRGRGHATLRALAYALCLSLLPLASAGHARAQAATEEEARAHFQLGRAAYDRGDFTKAAGEFEEAYRISKRAGLLYNLYLSYRDANEQAKAADALRRFLAEEKDIENRSQLEARLAALEKGLAQQPAASPAPTAAATQPAPAEANAAPANEQATPAPAPAAYTEAPSSEPTSKPKLVPLVLMAAGGALIIGSIVTGVMTLSAQSDLEHGCPTKSNCDPSLQSTKSRGQTLALVTDVLMVT